MIESRIAADALVGVAQAVAVAVGGLGAAGIAALFLSSQAPEILTDLKSVVSKYNPVTNIETIVSHYTESLAEGNPNATSWWDILDPTFWTKNRWDFF